MWHHWLRHSCWVSELWRHSPESDIFAQLKAQNKVDGNEQDGSYVLDWDSPELQKQMQDTMGFLQKGCSCQKGDKTKQCGHRKKGDRCTVMGALAYLKVQSTMTQLRTPKMKARRLIRTCPQSAQVALRMKMRTE